MLHDIIVDTNPFFSVLQLLSVEDAMDNQIKALRQSRGISQQKCADDLGISMRTLQRYEKGETENLTHFMKLADYLHVDLEVLLQTSESKGD